MFLCVVLGCIKSIPNGAGEEIAVEMTNDKSHDRPMPSSQPTHNPITRRDKKDSAARSNLKHLLHGDRGEGSPKQSVNSRSSSINSSDKKDFMGKAGWLYRKNENYKAGSRDDELFIPVWAILANNRLHYYSQKPSSSSGERSNPRGYVTVSKGGHCDTADEHNVKGVSLSGQGKNCFVVTEPIGTKSSSISVIFSAKSDTDRVDWLEKLVEAFEGIEHKFPLGTETLPHLSPEPVTNVKINGGSNRGVEIQVEFPKLIGPLRKKAVGGTFGVKSVKKRWFRLESGELRYYGEDQMKPSQLKGTVQIAGSKLLNEKNRKNFSLSMADGKLLEMEASNESDAQMWIDAIKETQAILAGSIERKERRRRDDVNLEKVTESKGRLGGNTVDTIRPIHKSKETRSFIKHSLQDHFLLNSLDDFDPLVDAMAPQVGLPGDVIIRQDTVGDMFYVLENGSALVYKNNSLVGSMHPGSAFGELALINDVKRAATVRIDETSQLWLLDRQTFRRVLNQQENSSKEEKISFLRRINLFEKLHDNSLIKIVNALNVAKFQEGAKIFKEGDVGNCLYIVFKGLVSLTQASSYGDSPKEIAKIGIGQSFGELALINDEPRRAAATAVEEVSAYTLDRTNFTGILGNYKEVINENIGTSILRKVSILKDLNQNQLETISRKLSRRTYAPNQEIIRQGAEGNSFFMIASGEVSIVVNNAEVTSLCSGAYFGEMALMSSEMRNATVIARSETDCLVLERTDFVNLLGPLGKLIEAEANRRAKSSTGSVFFPSFTSVFTGSENSQLEKNMILEKRSESSFDLSDFQTKCLIGKGKFDTVIAVLQIDTGKYYSLKVIEKELLAEFEIENQIVEMRDLCAEFDSVFLPTLYATYSDLTNLYMLQELVPGGDFWTILYDSDYLDTTHLGGINISSTVFYAANILGGLSYLHEHGITYRNLKPENVVMDSKGYLKLTDFNYAKRLLGSDTSSTICGNPEYMAPEMVLSKPYNRAVDFWALGIFLFELLSRSTPFDHSTTAGVYQRILASREYLTNAFSAGFDRVENLHAMRDLIILLLNSNPAKRLGMLRNGSDDVWSHEAFKDLKLLTLTSGDYVAPFTPKLLSSPAPVAFVCENQTDVRKMPVGRVYTGKFDFQGF